jgi:hypothetical protein
MAMALATWWLGDPMPALPDLDGFWVVPATDDQELARLNTISLDEVQRRRQAGHRPYLGTVNGRPVAYGWVAARTASIDEVGITFTLPEGERYLWDVAILPGWQGRGVEAHLLQGIIGRECLHARRFWIIQGHEGLSTGAGFVPAGRLSFGAGGRTALKAAGSFERARAGAALLGVTLIEAAAA